ncbi:MAG TPA: tetratricopeptide repeat protein [Burkholderiaceae bacterium]|nr:tetratricopeptide repeat protein [Burkholderiaceae bacterium]
MSVLNQMLRDLEKRGAMPAVVAAAGTATVARPALASPPRPAGTRRRWVWAAVLAIAAAFVGIHSWLGYRVQQSATPFAPLGAHQFAAVAAPPVTDVPAVSTPPASVAPAPAAGFSAPVPPTPAPADAPAPPRAGAATERPHRNHVAAARTQIAAAAARNEPAPAKETMPAPIAADPAAEQIVAPSNSEMTRDVDRAADLVARGRSTEAMQLLVQVLDRHPTNGVARSSLAALLAEAGQREPALHVLLAGSEVDPSRFAMPAAQLQAEMGDVQGALVTLARVPPGRRSAVYEALHAGLAQRAGDHMTAIASYRRALAQPQSDPVWWVGLGVSLEATGEPAEARDAYARAAAQPRLPADVRRYVAERLAVLDSRSQGRRAALADVF